MYKRDQQTRRTLRQGAVRLHILGGVFVKVTAWLLEQPRFAGRRAAMLALTAMLGAVLLSVPMFSQGNQGTIQGGVFDQSGGAIAGATVTILDPTRGLSRPLTTDSAGQYFAANLTPGIYTVRGEAKGFQTV
jgi:hypothetical protein